MSNDKKIENIEPILKALSGGKSVDVSEIEDIETFVKGLATATQAVVDLALDLLPGSSQDLDMEALQSIEKNIMAGYDKMGNSKVKKGDEEEGEEEDEEEDEEDEEGVEKGKKKGKKKEGEEEEEEEEGEEVEKAVNSSLFNTTAKFNAPSGTDFTIGDDEVVPGDTITYPNEAASVTGVDSAGPGETWAVDPSDILDKLRIAAQADPATAAMISLAFDSSFMEASSTEAVVETASTEGSVETTEGTDNA